MSDFGGIVEFLNEGYAGMVEFLEQKTRPEETLHKADDTNTNNILVCFIKKTSETIRTRGLGETKLGNGLTNFGLLRDNADEGIFIMENHRGRKGGQVLIHRRVRRGEKVGEIL